MQAFRPRPSRIAFIDRRSFRRSHTRLPQGSRSVLQICLSLVRSADPDFFRWYRNLDTCGTMVSTTGNCQSAIERPQVQILEMGQAKKLFQIFSNSSTQNLLSDGIVDLMTLSATTRLRFKRINFSCVCDKYFSMLDTVLNCSKRH
jgi:hypothetical protein